MFQSMIRFYMYARNTEKARGYRYTHIQIHVHRYRQDTHTKTRGYRYTYTDTQGNTHIQMCAQNKLSLGFYN